MWTLFILVSVLQPWVRCGGGDGRPKVLQVLPFCEVTRASAGGTQHEGQMTFCTSVGRGETSRRSLSHGTEKAPQWGRHVSLSLFCVLFLCLFLSLLSLNALYELP